MSASIDYINETFVLISNFSNFTYPNNKNKGIEMPLDIILFGSIFYTIIFIIGVCGNLSVIYVLLKEKELRNFTNYLLANLSIADLMVLFTCVPTGLHDLFAKERWYLGKYMCYLIAFIENCMGFASILTIFFITCDRYYVICRPLNVKSVMSQARTLKIIITIWIISILVNLPYIYFSEYQMAYFSDNQMFEPRCGVRLVIWTFSFYYMICTAFIAYFIIGFILITMFCRISKHLNKSTHFLTTNSSANMHPNPESEACLHLYKQQKHDSYHSHHENSLKNSPSSMHNKHVKQRKQLIYMLICVILVFYICLFPLKIWNLVLIIGSVIDGFFYKLGFKAYWYINITVRIFFYMNSSINPIIYNFLSKKFRSSFKRLFLFRILTCSKEELGSQNFDNIRINSTYTTANHLHHNHHQHNNHHNNHHQKSTINN